jgi:outer membrane protein OmpA-like peptidoglycan-associated protein
VATGHPDLAVHQNSAVHSNHIIPFPDHSSPPEIFYVPSELYSERSVVPTAVQSTVNFARLENKAASLTETHYFFHPIRSGLFLGHREVKNGTLWKSVQIAPKSTENENRLMPKEPTDPAKSKGDGFQNLVPRRKRIPRGVWVIVGLAAFFMIAAFGMTAYIVYHAVVEGRRQAHEQSSRTETRSMGSPSPSSSVALVQGAPTVGAESPQGTAASNKTSPTATSSAALATNDEDATRKAVLTRIDLMRSLSNKDKDELYAQVERARGFKKVGLVQFQTGRSAPGQSQVEDLIARIQDPDTQKLLSDPTVALIFVGYADTQGNEATNLEISRSRAETVQRLVSTRLKLANLMHSVGMGGQELFDKANREKNRVVEVWAVQP